MNFEPEHVVVGYHSHGQVHTKFCYSLARAVAYEGRRIQAVVEIGGPYTEEARNIIVKTFLGIPNSPPAEYLLMVDADIEFEKDAISKTMWVARNMDADVVWGNYALGTWSNSLFSKSEDTDYGLAMTNLEPYQIIPNTYAGGTGWCLIRRKLLLDMMKEYPGPWHWFDRDVIKSPEGEDVRIGEDMGFGRRVYKMGRKQFGYTGVHLIHHKNHQTVPKFMTKVWPERMVQDSTGKIEPEAMRLPDADSASVA